MIKFKIPSYCLIILLFIILVCCNKKSSVERKLKSQKEKLQDTIFAKFEFPDTVHLNKLYNGKIKYKSLLDSITTNVMEAKNGVNKYIVFSLTKTKHLNYDIQQLRKMKLDTFGAISNNVIPFYDIKFTELGTNYIYGIINDHVTIDALKKPKKANDKVRYIENETRLSHKVIVVK